MAEGPLRPDRLGLQQAWVRTQFPQLERDGVGRRRVYLDNAAGTLMPVAVAEAMREAALWANAQPERSWPASQQTGSRIAQTRTALRDFLHAAPEDAIYFNDSTTASLFKLRVAVEPRLAGGSVVVTDGDHYANISAWEWRAAWEVRRARMRPADGGLDMEHLATLLDAGTRVVAVAAATNGLGTRYDLPAVARLVRSRAPEALLVVDAVHLALHAPLDVTAWECDALAFSTYKLFGPFAGVLWVRASLAARLDPYRVEPHTEAASLLETGTLNNPTVAAIGAALAYLEELGARLAPAHPTPPDRRARLRIALEAIREYEASLSRSMLEGLRARPALARVRLFGVAEPERVAQRVPTFAFAVVGMADDEVEHHLWEDTGLQVAAGSHYAAAVDRGLGRTSVVRASFAHYTTPDDVERLLDALAGLAA
jgi:cysteine desulfurase family protein (TIGR01976 family)